MELGLGTPDPYKRGKMYGIVHHNEIEYQGDPADMCFWTNTAGSGDNPPTMSISFTWTVATMGILSLIGGALATGKYYLVI
jgi:hypothetical protein